MDYPEMKNTVFGEVLAELLEARGLRVTPFSVGKLAEDVGLDGWKVINRMASAGAKYAGPLDGLVTALDLSRREAMDLAFAFTFEERRAPKQPAEILGTVNGNLGGAIALLDDVVPEAFGGEDDYFRAKGAIAQAGQLVAAAQTRQGATIRSAPEDGEAGVPRV